MKLLLITLVFCFIGSIMGLKCYLCIDGLAGSTSLACRDPFNKTTTDTTVTTPTCDAGQVCAKSFLEAGNANSSFAVRGCVPSSACPNANENECISTEFQGLSGGACCCTTDLCNGAGSVSVNLLTAAAVGLIAVIFTL